MRNDDLQFEHNLRAYIREAQQTLEAATGATYQHVSFDTDGKWVVNTWGGNSTRDLTTKGAFLPDVVQEHMRRCGVEQSLSVLPALLAAPETVPVDDMPF